MNERGSRILLLLIFAAAVFFAVVHLAAVTHYWKIGPDSTDYVGGARSLASGEGYRNDDGPIQLFPPGTSLLLAVPLLFSKSTYFGMNLITTLFAILAFPVAYFWARKEFDNVTAALIGLATISSVFLFQEATQLLSDVIYLTISVSALYVLKSKSVESGRPGVSGAIAAGALVTACMVRIAGLTIAAAVLVEQLVIWRKRRAAFRWSLVLASGAALLVVAAWEYRSARLGISYIENALLLEPWIVAKGPASIADFLVRLPRNAHDYETIGRLLTNDAFWAGFTWLKWGRPLCNLLALLIFGWGLLIRLISRRSIDDTYLVIYLLVIGVYYSFIAPRMFLPILPLIFACTIHGVRDLIRRARALNPQFARALSILALVWVGAYLTTSAVRMAQLVPAEHRSEFGTYPIKYEYYSDAQFLAMWLQENTPKETRILCLHPDVIRIISERPTFKMPLTPDHRTVLDFIGKRKVQYIIANKKKREVRQMLIPAIDEDPAGFELLIDRKEASLYRVVEP